jgi:thiosulfate/3-mercaptopyruvate sulfurtransferase
MSLSADSPPDAAGYVQPSALVGTSWVQEHLNDPHVRILECSEDRFLYGAGHLPGAHRLDWHEHLNDDSWRDYVDRERLQRLLRSMGVDQDTTMVLYGDQDNWWAAFAFWVFSLFGLSRLKLGRLRIMDGGRSLWEAEGRPMTTITPPLRPGSIVVGERNDRLIRAFRTDVLEHIGRGGRLLDVRSPAEFLGTRLHMAGYPDEGALRGGHIPGAVNVPWESAVDPRTHRFRSAAELRGVYQLEHGLQADEDVITYCRIGERSAHSWFVLTHLLGFASVRNYDGSWCEWGNAVRVPIEKQAPPQPVNPSP